MIPTQQRLAHLADCSELFERWTGPFDEAILRAWLDADLGDANALEHPIAYGPIHSQAVPPTNLLHVVSGNTPHAAFQSLLRALVIGAPSTIKLPSAGLPALEAAVASLPEPLKTMVATTTELPPGWRNDFPTVVVYGSDETLQWFRAQTPPTSRLILHGHKLSIAMIEGGDLDAAAALAARDVSLFDQQGCLSVQTIYLTERAGTSPREFAAMLAREMASFDAHTPRGEISPAEAAGISSLREKVRFAASTEPENFGIWASRESTHWTVIFEHTPTLRLSPLNRVVYVKPWPGSGLPSEHLGPARIHLSTIALYPFVPNPPAELLGLGATRICELGRAQEPSLFWHHDGVPPLSALVSWLDLG